MSQPDWRIERRQGVCASSGREFLDDEPVFSLLAVHEGELLRRDFSVDAWRAMPDDDRPKGAVWWKTRHRVVEKARTMDLESIEALFGALEDTGEEALIELRFLIALVLLRKRRLKLVRTRTQDGEEALMMRKPRRKHEFAVLVRDLDAERRAHLREVLERLFEGADVDELVTAAKAPSAVPTPNLEEGEPENGEPENGDPENGDPENADPGPASTGEQGAGESEGAGEGGEAQADEGPGVAPSESAASEDAGEASTKDSEAAVADPAETPSPTGDAASGSTEPGEASPKTAEGSRKGSQKGSQKGSRKRSKKKPKRKQKA